MAETSTHVDIAARVDAAVEIFRKLEDDADNLATQLQEELRGAKLLSSRDPRVKPFIDLLRAGLLAGRLWVADMQQETTEHDVDGQRRHFVNIECVTEQAQQCFDVFVYHTRPQEDSARRLSSLFDFVAYLKRNFEAWATKEKFNPNTNPPQLDSTDVAEMPPARRDSAQRQQWVNENVNPGDSVARTGNPYIITGHRSTPLT